MNFSYKRKTATILILLFLFVTSSALAVSSGDVINRMIDFLDSFLDNDSLFEKSSYRIDKNNALGKTGVIYISLDDSTIRMIGSTSSREYSFTSEQNFALTAGALFYAVDAANLFDYDISIYYTANGKTESMSKQEVADLAATFVQSIQ